MKKLRNTEAELKRASLIKKNVYTMVTQRHTEDGYTNRKLEFFINLVSYSCRENGKINKAVFISAKRLRK